MIVETHKPFRTLAAGLPLLALIAAGPINAAPTRDLVVHDMVVRDAGGANIVRRVVEGALEAPCPVLSTDHGAVPLTPRRGRPVKSSPRLVEQDFTVTICEARLSSGTRRARLDGRTLPLTPAMVRRIVVIGDTGCRLKDGKGGGPYQACNDPERFPFARIAAAAARWKPDLVVHVGDYHYRESPCPGGVEGCRGSPSGYGFDAWKADFLDPAAPLLAAAPWVMARGNHETCERAGLGFRLLLDPAPLDPRTDCADPAKDFEGDFSPTYAVPLGGGDQLIVFDSAAAGLKPLSPGDPVFERFVAMREEIEALSRKARRAILVDHHPFLAYAAGKGPHGDELYSGNMSLISTFGASGRALAPERADLVLSGHVHVWEALSFSSGEPAQIVAGFSGTEEDPVPLPATAPRDQPPAPGAVVAMMSSWTDGFGFMTLTRTGAAAWRIDVRDVDGRVINRCRLRGKALNCALGQVPARPAP
jgi:hypothetical protein